MERTGLSRPDDDRCYFLHWKGMYIDSIWTADVPHSNDRLYWCHKTQSCLGPEGKTVDEYECHEGRKCYKAL